MDIHSSFRHQDVADLIPELNGALADPSKIDPDVLTQKLEATLAKQLEAIQALASSEDFQTIRSKEDPKALARVLGGLEKSMLDIKRVVTFAQLAEMHWADQAHELQAPLQGMLQQIQGLGGFLNQSFTDVIQYVARMDDAKLQAMMADTPELQKFAKLIERCQKAPKSDPEKIAQLNSNNFMESIERFQQSANRQLSEDERKKAFAEGLAGVIRFKQEGAVAVGFKDTLAQFSFQNDSPHDMIDHFAEASQKRMPKLIEEFVEIQKQAEDRLPKGKNSHRYSWDETKDIVCATYAKLDPELGNLARRAFDEGWILAKEYGVANPHTLPGLPVSESPTSHPFAATNFDGGAMDVIFVGHKMAHVLSNYIAGQKQGVFTHDAPMIVQESFSHFGEALLEQEMLKRGETPAEKARVNLAFIAKEFDALTVIPFAKFEEDLYALVKSKGKAAPTFDEINDLFKKNMGVLEKLTGEEADVREMPALWNVLMQPPHNVAVYPVTKIMSAALHDEFERNPEQFRKRYHEIMEAGGNMGVAKLWDTLLGKGVAEQKAFINDRLDHLIQRTEAIKAEIAAMPELPKLKKGIKVEDGDIEQVIDGKPSADASGFPVVGHFTGALAKKYSERDRKSMMEAPKPWMDRAQADNITSLTALRG